MLFSGLIQVCDVTFDDFQEPEISILKILHFLHILIEHNELNLKKMYKFQIK